MTFDLKTFCLGLSSTHSPVGSSSLISNQTSRSYLLTHWPRLDLVMVFSLVAGTGRQAHIN